MATKTVTFRCREEEAHQMSHSMDLSSQIKKKTFTSSDEEASYSEFYPIISADVMSMKELLDVGEFPRHRTWEVLKQTLDTEELRQRDTWTLFGNEAEKVEVEVIRNQHTVRKRADRLALRQEAERKASIHKKFLEDLSMRGPDFPIPLRNHAVWEGMAVKLSCTVQGCPSPEVTWYKDGVPLGQLHQPWNVKLQQTHGLNTLEIRRASVNDAGEYKAVAKSPLGEAITFATLLVKSYKGGKTGLETSRRPAVEEEARIGLTFPPTFAIEGEALSLKCDFTSSLLAFQQDVTWLKDGVPLRANSKVELQTALRSSSLIIRSIHKELEGIYTVRLRTCDGFEEHSAYIYVKDGVAAMPGAPGSPMNVQCHDVNKDYILLTWTPPSADGACKIQGYYVEKCDIGVGDWVRCNETPQSACCYPIRGLLENTIYKFRVRALNQAGVGRPSKPTEPIVTSDPAEPGRRMVFKVFDGKEMVITKDELEGEVRVPLPPADVRACEVSESFVVIGWTEPEPRGREPLTFYVERSVAGHDSWHLASLGQTVASPRFAVFDLQKGKSYCFRVRSINKFGVSDPSPPSEPISLGQPVAPPSPPHSIQALRDTDTSVQLLWKEPKVTEDILGYYLYYCEAGTKNWRTVNNKPVTSSRFTIHGLTPNKMYVYRVKSVSRAGNSEYSEESTAVRAKAALCIPSRPSAIVLLNCTGTEMVIGWRAPTSIGGDPVRGYYLDQTDTASTVWHEVNTQPVKERTYRVSGLQVGHRYRFRVFATNVVGLGPRSEPSDAFLCEPWTMDQPGCPYDLVFREVRMTSLVLLWEGPMYEGRSQVTGYLVEISNQYEADGWTLLTQEPIPDTHLKVSGLQAGKSYILRVSAVNKFGVGVPSLPSEPITAQTKPGIKDVEIGVDNDGFIFLGFECPLGTEASQLVWAKNYTEPIDGGRARVELKGNRSTITFLNPSEEDLALYTVVKGDEQDISSSYNFTAEDLEKMQELSWQVRNPLIALKTPWTVDVSEQGSIRLWLQTEPLSEAAQLHLILNDREITSTPERKINFHKAHGILEVLIDQLCPDDEGSYTAQLQDGRAKNQFTLVLVDEKFRQTLAQSDANRKDWKRKLGPHFLEFLSWQVTKDCELIFRCQVTNVNRDTCLKWFKDGGEISNTTYDPKTGISTYTVPQVTRKEMGVYRAVVSDGRGEDISTLELVDEEFEKLQQKLSKQCALSAGPLEIQCTAEGIKISCSLKYYLGYLKTSWFHREKRVDQDQRARPGSSMQKLWVEIISPTESDKGKYCLQMFDGTETHTRSLDVSGQAFEDAMLEYQRLKQVAIAEKNRARVTKGLPDVVAIMEHKTLCLTCFVEGDPAPEMFWLKNDRELFSAGQYNISSDHQCTTLTINKVNMEDSGLYSIFARNKHGSQTVNVTVSVYKRGEKPRAGAVEM